MTKWMRSAMPITFVVVFIACSGEGDPGASVPQRTVSESPPAETPSKDSAAMADLFEPNSRFRFSDVDDPRAAQAEVEARQFMGDNLIGFSQKAAKFRGRPIGLIQAFLVRDPPPLSEAKSVVELSAQALGIQGEARPLGIGDVAFIVSDDQGATVMVFTRKNVMFSFTGGFPSASRRLAGELVNRVDGT